MKSIFSNIDNNLKAVGSSLDDIVITRLFVVDVRNNWEEVGKCHGEIFKNIHPASTTVGAELLFDWMKIEIEV